jgi:hypothetical protein
MANEWREHAMLEARFLPDYPDDLRVVVHDGGPQITRNEPEIVWVTVTGMDGDLFWGRVLNQPHNLQTVRRGDEIKFVMPEGWLAPILVTEKYLRERGAWIIHPCPQCGLSELFDAPSDLIRVVFPNPPLDAEISRFTATCPQCGGVQCVESRRSLAAAGAEPVTPQNVAGKDRDALTGQEALTLSGCGGGDLGGTYLETAKLRVENMTGIGTLLATIKDDASAEVALPKLEKAIARHKDLSKKLESYKLSVVDHLELAQEQRLEYLATSSDLTVSKAAAQANANFAQSLAQGKAEDIEAAMNKIE